MVSLLLLLLPLAFVTRDIAAAAWLAIVPSLFGSVLLLHPWQADLPAVAATSQLSTAAFARFRAQPNLLELGESQASGMSASLPSHCSSSYTS